MTAQTSAQQHAAPAIPAAALSTAGEAGELDRLLQQERIRAENNRNALEPKTWAEAREFAKMVHESGMYLDKDGRPPSEGNIMVRVMTGRQLGLASTLSMLHVYEIYGRPGISAQLKRSLVRRHPDCLRYEMLESDHERCVWVVHRRGGIEKKIEFKLDDAKRAQLVKKDSNWEKWARRMLQARASSEAADVEFEDACMGLSTVDELLDVEAEREPMAAPVGAAVTKSAPSRDWAKETADMAAKVAELVAKGETKTARELYNLFAQEAPEAWLDQLKAAYNRAIAEAKAKGGAPSKPVEKQDAKASQPALPVGEYLPPNKRGDSYEGPDQPPPGWKP